MAGMMRDAIYVAQTQLGFVEGPKNNQNPYAAEVGHANFQPWCASFLAAVMKRAEVPIPSTSAYTPTMANGFRATNAWFSKGIVGDVVFFHWPDLGRIAHVGLVERVQADGSYVCIEGNTDSAGGRTGGRVMRQVRRANIAGFGRPVYVPPPPPDPSPVLSLGMAGQKVADIQSPLFIRRYLPEPRYASVDSDFGPATEKAVKRLQYEFGLPVTGVVDKLEWQALRRIVHGPPA